jgi:hypothetical protein
MHPLTAVMVSQALADEHRRAADRRRRSWPYRPFRPNATGSRA